MAEKPSKNTSKQYRKTKTQFKGNRRGSQKKDVSRVEERQARTPLEMFTPTNWSPKGEAVFMDGSRRKLLWGGIPKEKSLFRMVHRGQNQDLLEFVRSNRPHATRVSPLCSHYDRCGGCPLMHMRDAGQHNAKLSILYKHLEKKGLAHIAPKEIYNDVSLRFRHQTKLAVTAESGAMQIGVRNRRNQVASIPNCEVVTKQLKLINKRLAHKIIEISKGPKEERIFAYEGEDKPGLRYIVARQSMTTKETHICFVATHHRQSYQKLADWLIEFNIPISGVSIHINEEPGNAIFAKNKKGQIQSEVLAGTATITEEVNGITYKIGVGDFFQVNPRVAGKIQNDLLKEARRFADSPMVDLYCGVGFFGLALAREFGHVFGIEGVEGSIRRARSNAFDNNIKADFASGVVDDIIEDKISRLNQAFIVVDPARRGLESYVIEELHKYTPKAIAYISCSPRSFAEDLQKFVSLGWRVSSIRAYDMIPNSVHIEMMAILEPSKSLVDRYRKPRRKVIR